MTKKNTSLLPRIFFITISLFLLTGCDSNQPAGSTKNTHLKSIQLTESDWSASFSPKGSNKLEVKGTMELPSPGYQILGKMGKLDRSFPPSVRIHLQLIPPSEPVIQMISQENIEFELYLPVNQLKEVILVLGEKVVATITMGKSR